MRLAARLILPVVLALIPDGTKSLRAAASCDPIRTFADGRQPAREIFVSPEGNDTTGDGTRAKPFHSPGRALQGVRPGDAIRLLPGTYAPGTFITGVAGTAEAPIWLGGAPGEARPVIRGGSQALHLSRVRYLVVEHLKITGATGNGLNCDDGGDYANPNATRHVIFRHLSLHDIGTGGNQDGLKLSGVNDYFVLDCELARMSAGGSGLDQVGCHRGLIARCTFADMGSNAIQCKGGSADIEIRWNRFFNGGARAVNLGGSTGFPYFRPPLSTTTPNVEARNIRVVANLFRGADAPVAWVGAVDSLVANNTFVEPRRWILRILQETVSSGDHLFAPCGHNQFVNNLVYFNRSRLRMPVNLGPNTDAASFRFAHNLWFAYDQPGQSRPDLPAPEERGVYGTDPLWRDAVNGDFSVSANSPAVARGRKLPSVKADLLERCYADPPTLGAFEANPPPPPPADTDGDGLPDTWEEAHLFDKDDPADAWRDADDDRLSNFGEYLAGTNPHDPRSVFVLGTPRLVTGDLSLPLATLPGRVYRVEVREFAGPAAWRETHATPGTGNEIEFRHPASGNPGQMFRVKVEPVP